MKKNTPDFLVIGAQKAGTTFLHRVLRNHPEIYIPYIKELHYYDTLRHNYIVRRKLTTLKNLFLKKSRFRQYFKGKLVLRQ